MLLLCFGSRRVLHVADPTATVAAAPAGQRLGNARTPAASSSSAAAVAVSYAEVGVAVRTGRQGQCAAVVHTGGLIAFSVNI